MGDIAIFKTAQHMGNRINFSDIGEKLIAQSLALGRAAHKPGNINKAQTGRDALGGTGNIGEAVKAGIRHGDIADIRLNRAERKIGRLRAGGFGQRIEQG